MKFEDINRSSIIKIIKISLISIVFLSVGLILFVSVQKKTQSDTSNSLTRKYHPGPLRITGLKQHSYSDGKLTTLVEADEFRIRPRKQHFLFNMSPIINIRPIFNIRPFNEAILKNAKLEIHLYPESCESEISEKAGLFFIEKNMLTSDLKGMGVVTRVLIKGLAINIYKNEILSLKVMADKAYFHLRKKKLNLIDATITHILSQKHIMSRFIIWDEKEKVFKIPGQYIAVTPKGKTAGMGIKLDMNFVATSFL